MSQKRAVSKPRSADWPGLEAYVNEAGMTYKWADFFDHKYRADACYVVLAWENEDGTIGFCDVAGSSPRGPWEFQNDSMECTREEWDALRVDPYCDGFTIPGRDEE